MTARRPAAPTPPPWQVPEHYDTAVLPSGRAIFAGEHLKVHGRHGEWEFVRRSVSAKEEWLDVTGPVGSGKDRRTHHVSADSVTPVAPRKRRTADA